MIHNSSGGKMLEYIAQEVPLFKSIEKKKQFIEVMGALSLRLISLAKAAEMMEMEKIILYKRGCCQHYRCFFDIIFSFLPSRKRWGSGILFAEKEK